MFYKVLKNGNVIDTLDVLVYLKWQPKHQIMVLSDERDAQAVLSSDQNTIWHLRGLPKIPVPGYDTVELIVDEGDLPSTTTNQSNAPVRVPGF